MTKRIRRGHIGTRLSPKYKGRYGKLNGNIGVSQGSAISALLFIIYLDDMMEDMEALNRRTNLPIRIIQDRPHRQKKDLLWEEIQDKQETYEEQIETRTLRNYTQNNEETKTTEKEKERKLAERKNGQQAIKTNKRKGRKQKLNRNIRPTRVGKWQLK